jgi:hypothetical protein
MHPYLAIAYAGLWREEVRVREAESVPCYELHAWAWAICAVLVTPANPGSCDVASDRDHESILTSPHLAHTEPIMLSRAESHQKFKGKLPN